MDEEALLGEAAGPIGDRMISKEEEDALLNDEPTTSDSATTVIAAAAVEQIPADPYAPQAAEAAEADEDELMQHTDTESNEASDETRELLENNDLPASSSNSVSSSQSPAPSSIFQQNTYFKSVIFGWKGRQEKAQQRHVEQTQKRMNRMMEISEDQRKKIVDMASLQVSIQTKLKELAANFESLAAQQGVKHAREAVFAAPDVPLQRTARMASVNTNNSSNNSRKRRGQPEHAPPARRSSGAPPPVQPRRNSNGQFTNDTPSPVVQPVQLQQQRSAPPMRVQRTVSQPTPPAARAATARPQQPQNQSTTPVIPEPLPRPGQYQQAPSFGSKTSPAGARQHANGQRLQQVVQQHQPTPLRAPSNSNLNGVAAAASASSSSTGMTQAQRAASERMAVQQQQSRKRPHPHSQQQLVQQAVSAGSSGVSAAGMATADKIRWCLLASATLNDPQMHKTVTSVLSQTRHVERMEQELAANAAEKRLPLVFASRRVDKDFVVPAPNEKRKIEVAVEKQLLADPTTRPNEGLPVESDWMRNDRFAPQIELMGEHEDFTASGKVGGRIRFTPPSSWPENTARICLFYYIGTKNSQEWLRSDFATVDLSREGDNFREASVRFIFTLGPEYFHVQVPGVAGRAAVLHPTIWKEVIGMVAFACAGDSAAGTECKLRGEEKAYDFGAQKALSERRKIERYGNNFAGFYTRSAADVARLATPEKQRMAEQQQRQLQLQQQNALQQRAAAAQAAAAGAADDDDDIAIIN